MIELAFSGIAVIAVGYILVLLFFVAMTVRQGFGWRLWPEYALLGVSLAVAVIAGLVAA